MTSSPRWTVEHVAREDAERVFVPLGDLPDAAIGDVVDFAPDGVVTRSGRIAERIDDGTRGRFFAVELDRPTP